MAFDITKLNQSSFRGIPFYTREEDLSGAQRLTDHKFINGGTKTESNGIENDIFKITGYIGGDDYLTQKAALREAFKDITSGELIDKFYGVQQVYVEKWSIKESITKFGLATIDITFKLAENEVIEDTDIVYTADVRTEAIDNFKEDFDNEIGDDLLDFVIEDITNFWNGVGDSIKFVEDETGAVDNIKTAIGRAISNVRSNIISVDSLSGDIENVWTNFDGINGAGIFTPEDQKSFTNTIRQTIEESSSREPASTTEAITIRQSQIYINASVAGLTQTAIVNLEDIDFNTGDDFGSIKDDVLTIMALLERDIVFSIENIVQKIVIKQNLLDKYHLSRREFVQFYTQKYSGLQNLKEVEIVATIDILNLTMDKYNDINRSMEVLINNDIVDPIFISGKIKLLDR